MARSWFSAARCAFGFASALTTRAATAGDEILRIEGAEVSHLDPARHDGGLPLARGVQSIGVFRAAPTRPDLTDSKGFTYHHHPDLAAWRGRLYVGWASSERDEDTWPARELYSTSQNGTDWSAPEELFPQGISTPLRLYFFHAPNDRMLAIAGLRINHDKTDEARKGPLVVREIRVDHSLGSVFTLRPPNDGPRASDPPPFATASDPGVVAACRSLLANHVALETQDYGLLLDAKDRSPWHDASHWPNGKLGAGFLKAPSFFHRRDGALVGIGKNGWTLISHDGGATWDQPVVPPTLVTNNAKVWGQRTSDGRYALVYNPQPRSRFPLALVTSDDGVAFRDMHAVQEDFPAQRYPGLNKNIGLQYVRGISEWASDGSWHDDAMWLVYSANKEDIWVSRVPLGAAREAALWNLYTPKWSKVAATPDGTAVAIENREPCDYAGATRLFARTARVAVSLTITAQQFGRGALDLNLLGGAGGARPVRLHISADGAVSVTNGKTSAAIATLTFDRSVALTIDADALRHKFSVSVDGQRKLADADFADSTDAFERFSIRVSTRPETVQPSPVAAELDQPADPTAYRVRDLRIETRP